MKNLASLMINPNRRKLLLGISAFSLVMPVATFAQSASLNAADFGLKANVNKDQSLVLQTLINKAADIGLSLFIPAGKYNIGAINLPNNISLFGISGATILHSSSSEILISAKDKTNISIKDISFFGAKQNEENVVSFLNCENITFDNVDVSQSAGNGVYFENCQGSIINCNVSNIKRAAIHLQNSNGMIVSKNNVKNCANGGILVWRYENGRDGTIISDNQISGIGSQSGNGQNGNGINVYLADEVIVANNSITDCAFSAIRLNSTNNVIVKGNICTQCQEVAIFSEFAFSGSIITENLVDQAATGISITNFDDGGRLAICSNNIVRNIWKSSPTNPDTSPIAIFAEADTAEIGNVVENVPGIGIYAGWGPYLRDVLVTNNIVRNSFVGIGVSVSEGAGIAHVSNNLISNSKIAAISGMRWLEPAGSDLSKKPNQFDSVKVKDNSVS